MRVSLPAISALSAALSSAALPAAAMIEPCSIDAMVREADTVVQISGIGVTLREDGICEVTGSVVHALRGPLSPGWAVSVAVDCTEDVEVMCGGTIQNLEAIRRAEMIELHLTEGRVAGDGAGFTIIDAAQGGTEQHAYYCEG